ncbi:hypothetical protein MPL1032_120060 [Mesorhizobium plurifarium]|uniref:Uncharacterized protein n=1 Tax=Mesorhizobium plurifarium TaxID=69974 RepID=A0A0K2VQQ8_MESPL|nr:hypothetical protein MPL1032_120060 [Mesorhizobium plurifarium]
MRRHLRRNKLPPAPVPMERIFMPRAATIGYTQKAQAREKTPYPFICNSAGAGQKSLFLPLHGGLPPSPFRCATPAWRKGHSRSERGA